MIEVDALTYLAPSGAVKLVIAPFQPPKSDRDVIRPRLMAKPTAMLLGWAEHYGIAMPTLLYERDCGKPYLRFESNEAAVHFRLTWVEV